MTVIKRDGTTVQMDTNKILKSLEWATKGITDVSVSDILNAAKLQFTDEIKTSEINQALIRTTNDMSTVMKIGYDKVSARLAMQEIYHEAYSGTEQLSISEFLKRHIDSSEYCAVDLMRWYSLEEFTLT